MSLLSSVPSRTPQGRPYTSPQSQPNSAAIRITISPDGELTFFRRDTAMDSPRHWRRLSLESLRLYQQPIVLLQPEGEKLAGELLCRFSSGDGTTYAPTEFIDVAEQCGVMPMLDRAILGLALKQIKKNAVLRGGHRTCINISAQTLIAPRFAEFVIAELDSHQIDAGVLCLEITETAPIKDFDSARAAIATLRQRGCQFALDDFGTGFASLDTLMRLPIDYIKIPGQFVMDDTRANTEMLRFIIALARSRNLPTIAEHVTSAAVLHRMRRLGVHYAQGYAVGTIEPFALAS
jgi:EAL domain-containing protein (putative c-di-GMP-specific phosphodiesterase class I)